jgi:hypothetical protein
MHGRQFGVSDRKIALPLGVAAVDGSEPLQYSEAVAVGLERLVDQPYEVPESPDLHLLAGGEEPDALAQRVIQHLLTCQIVN